MMNGRKNPFRKPRPVERTPGASPDARRSASRLEDPVANARLRKQTREFVPGIQTLEQPYVSGCQALWSATERSRRQRATRQDLMNQRENPFPGPESQPQLHSKPPQPPTQPQQPQQLQQPLQSQQPLQRL